MQSTAISSGERRSTHAVATKSLAPHDEGRAGLYALIAALLLPASTIDRHRLLHALREGHPAEQPLAASPLCESLTALGLAAGAIDADALRDEHAAIFVDVGRPQVDPCGSKYVGGASTLVAVRAGLHELGLVRRGGMAEAEDHLGMLCEAMRVLIAVVPQPLARQRAFFDAHIAPWYRACADDIRTAKAANFFVCVADVVEAFLDVEGEAFAMDDDDGGEQ